MGGWGRLCAGRSEILKHSGFSAGEEYQLCVFEQRCFVCLIVRNKGCINTHLPAGGFCRPPEWILFFDRVSEMEKKVGAEGETGADAADPEHICCSGCSLKSQLNAGMCRRE